MKHIPVIISILAAVCTVSCVHEKENTVMTDVAAEFEKCIEYHDRGYMKSREMSVPHNVDEDNGKQLSYLFAFEQDNTVMNGGINRQRYSMNWMTPVEWTSFRLLFENALTRTMRFGRKPLALVDDAGRKAGAVESLEESMPQSEGVLLFKTMLSSTTTVSNISSFRGGGKLHQTTLTMNIACVPQRPANTEKKDSLQPFSSQVTGSVYQKYDKNDRLKSGILISENTIEALHHMQGAAAIVNTIHHLYRDYPVVGPITDFEPDDGIAVIRAAGDNGLLPEMEFVIYARKKADGKDAARIPLFNATLLSFGATGSSTLKLWRKNTSDKTAREIIKSIFNDFNAAREDYDFYGCCDGLAEWPAMIIDRPFADD